MNDSYVVAVDGLSALRGLDDIPADIKRAASRAVNTTLRRTRTASAREMREQVNFPARYLSGDESRLSVTQASGDNLEGEIRGRFRPTSLARFARGNVGGNGVTIQVAPGMARRSRRMFLIRLRAGAKDIETQNNLGLAIRLKPGEALENKYRMRPFTKGLYLLYGPSVSQVFADVADNQAPGAADFLEREFNRLLKLDI